MMRAVLAAVLLFIAPSAWGQNHTLTIGPNDTNRSTCYADGKSWPARHENGGLICRMEDAEIWWAPLTSCKPDAAYCGGEDPPGNPPMPRLLPNSGGHALSCEPGWTPVAPYPNGALKCAWVLKEPIYK